MHSKDDNLPEDDQNAQLLHPFVDQYELLKELTSVRLLPAKEAKAVRNRVHDCEKYKNAADDGLPKCIIKTILLFSFIHVCDVLLVVSNSFSKHWEAYILNNYAAVIHIDCDHYEYIRDCEDKTV